MSDRRRRFGGLKDIIHDNVRQGLSAGWSVLGDLVKPAKQLIDDEPIIILQCGKVVMENTPRRMRTELWMSSLHRKGVGVAAAGKYEDMLMHKVGMTLSAVLFTSVFSTAMIVSGYDRLPQVSRAQRMLDATTSSTRSYCNLQLLTDCSTDMEYAIVSCTHGTAYRCMPQRQHRSYFRHHITAALAYSANCMQSISDEAASDIDKDLARTFPSMRRFASQEGQEALRRVLLAYAAYDPEVRTVSGMVKLGCGWDSVAHGHTQPCQQLADQEPYLQENSFEHHSRISSSAVACSSNKPAGT